MARVYTITLTVRAILLLIFQYRKKFFQNALRARDYIEVRRDFVLHTRVTEFFVVIRSYSARNADHMDDFPLHMRGTPKEDRRTDYAV